METEPDIAGTVFAGCKIICKLGQGGMGSVYKAHQAALDKFVCVKLLAPELAREQRNIDFFLREARSAAKLDHPNIVHIYNFGQENGSYFILMSYVEGKTLHDLVAEKGPLPVKQATEIMSGVMLGLGHAHSKSIIHRDIKPSNILVGADNIPRIVDFGLARSITEEKQLTMAGEMVGTAYFMSPEQGLAGTVDNRADLYAAGATYFYILTGRYPFDGKSSIEVIHKHIGDPLPNVMLIRPDIPLWACRIIERLMQKKPEERYQAAGEVIAEFVKYGSDEGYTESTSNEITFDIPEITSRMETGSAEQQVSQEASLERSDPKPSTRVQASPPRPAPPPPPRPAQARPGLEAPPLQKPALQLAGLHNSLKMGVHLALTLAGTGCFILAGASGTVPGSLSSPISENPVTAFVMALAGIVLYSWAVWQKPRKFTTDYTIFALAAAVAAYAGGAYIPMPPNLDALPGAVQSPDTVARAFMAVKLGLQNMFSGANFIVYAFFLYLAASKAVFKENWIFKALAVAAYLGGLALTYFYFKAGAEITPERIWLAACGLLALLGLAAALTQKTFSLFFNPQFLFLAANLTMFSMFTNPQIEAMTAEKVRVETDAVTKSNRDLQAAYLQALETAKAEVLYDVEGRPIEPVLPRQPEEIKPPERGKLQIQARLDYYQALSLRVRGTLAGSAGIIFIAFFLALMANACFIEELTAAYRDKELY
ncbi:MAG: serine/threonine-protein kinase [Elusimicrobiota bacterium]|nr:serine/threonine-protein kinase [Elusimicrobiota bacterium]